MKYIPILSMILIAGFSACTKNSNTVPAPPAVLDNGDTAISNLKYSGMFESTTGKLVTGNSNIFLNNSKYTLVLDDMFTTSSGPDLHVYLSMGRVPDVFIDLGKLRANSGEQAYDIPGMPDFSAYTHVLIHCVQYNHIFGISELK